MVLNPDPSQLSFIKPFLQTNIEENHSLSNDQFSTSTGVHPGEPSAGSQSNPIFTLNSSAKGPDSDRGRRSGPAISDSKEKV